MDEVLGARRADQRLQCFEGRPDERAQGAGRRPRLFRRAGADEAQQPRQRAPADSSSAAPTGASGSKSQPGTFHTTPGIATGVTDEPLKHPALPKEAPRPGSSGSIRKTLWPSRCSQLAAHTPTMPAPITPTRFAPCGIPSSAESTAITVAAPERECPHGCSPSCYRLFGDTERCRSGRTGRSRNDIGDGVG